MRVLFIEPPKDFWFILGQYISPPFGILILASYLETKIKNIEIKVIDYQAKGLNWHGCARSSQEQMFTTLPKKTARTSKKIGVNKT